MIVTAILGGLDFRQHLFVGMVFVDLCGFVLVLHQNVALLICLMVYKEYTYMKSIDKFGKYVPHLDQFGACNFRICERFWVF